LVKQRSQTIPTTE